MQAADQRVDVATADRYPRLSISADVTTTTRDIADVFDTWLLSLAANITAPLFEGAVGAKSNDRGCPARAHQWLWPGGADRLQEIENATSKNNSNRLFW